MDGVMSYRREGHVITTSESGESRVDISLDWSAPDDVHLLMTQATFNGSERREIIFVEGVLYANDPETGGVWERQPNQPGWSFAPAQSVPRLCRPEFVEHPEAGQDEVVVAGHAALHESRGQDGEEVCDPAPHVFYTVWVRQPEYLLTRFTLSVDGSLNGDGIAKNEETEEADYTFSRYNESVRIEAPLAE